MPSTRSRAGDAAGRGVAATGQHEVEKLGAVEHGCGHRGGLAVWAAPTRHQDPHRVEAAVVAIQHQETVALVVDEVGRRPLRQQGTTPSASPPEPIALDRNSTPAVFDSPRLRRACLFCATAIGHDVAPAREDGGLAVHGAAGVRHLPDGAVLDPETPARPGYAQPPIAGRVALARHLVEQALPLGAVRRLGGQAGRQRGELGPGVLEASLRRRIGVDEARVGRRVVGEDAERGRLVEPADSLDVSHAGRDQRRAGQEFVAG